VILTSEINVVNYLVQRHQGTKVFMRPSSLGGGPHIASHSVCPSVCLSVRPVMERHVAPPSELK